MEKLSKKEQDKIISDLKKSGEYGKYQQMILDDFEEHHIVYTLETDELIAMAVKYNTIPFKMTQFYNWTEINLLIEEDEYLS